LEAHPQNLKSCSFKKKPISFKKKKVWNTLSKSINCEIELCITKIYDSGYLLLGNMEGLHAGKSFSAYIDDIDATLTK